MRGTTNSCQEFFLASLAEGPLRYNGRLRYFFRRHDPPVTKILLVESGPRHLFEQVIPAMRRVFGDSVELDLVTCFGGAPADLRGEVFRIAGYPSGAGREDLLRELLKHDYPAVAIICAAEPIMTKWKWWLAAKLPAKLLIVNENGDFFWADWRNRGNILHFALFRAGLTGAAAVPSITRFIFFPLTLTYLLLYAATVHLRRRIRLL